MINSREGMEEEEEEKEEEERVEHVRSTLY